MFIVVTYFDLNFVDSRVSKSIVSLVAGKTAKYDGKKLVFMNIGSWRSDS
jgi:hypothetical protein